MPWTKLDRTRTGRPAGSTTTRRATSSSSSRRNSSRARRRAQAVVGPEGPEGRVVGFDRAADVEAQGVVELGLVEVGDAYHSTTLSPAVIGMPCSSVSRTAVRRMCSTGVAQRMTSSTPFGISDRVGVQARQLVGVVHERQQPVGDRGARGLVAGEHQQLEEVAVLGVGQPVAVDLGVHQR